MVIVLYRKWTHQHAITISFIVKVDDLLFEK